jgi:hypothetical protein
VRGICALHLQRRIAAANRSRGAQGACIARDKCMPEHSFATRAAPPPSGRSALSSAILLVRNCAAQPQTLRHVEYKANDGKRAAGRPGSRSAQGRARRTVRRARVAKMTSSKLFEV